MSLPNKKDLTKSQKAKIKAKAQELLPMNRQQKIEYLDTLDKGERYLIVAEINECKGVRF